MRNGTSTNAAYMLSLATALLLSSHCVTPFMNAPAKLSTLSPLHPSGAGALGKRNRKHTALNVWWFGGSENEQQDDSCELVAVRIEKTSANSRKIAGDIIIPKPIDDVWAILTDYDNLAIHVPNLVVSKQVNPGRNIAGTPGDGTYKCRLFQKGAQKIVGFEFGASVTMDMTEVVHRTREEKKIIFKCVESQFFSEFDGIWKVTETTDPDDPTSTVSKVEYVVDVRPRGPVPVQALEWRIREDVPTNLRAVKAASIDVGAAGVLALNNSLRKERNGSAAYSSVSSRTGSQTAGRIANAANNTRRNAGQLMNRDRKSVV